MEDFVPLCLYFNRKLNSSFIGLPNKVRKNNQTVFECSQNPELEFVTQFYVLNPDFATRPSGMNLLCAKNANLTTTSVEVIYDPFNYEKGCIRFIAWIRAIPSGTPLYIWENENSTYITFDSKIPDKKYKQAYFSPIYVLMDPRVKATRLSAIENGEFEIKDDIPQFKFTGYQGRCIPDKDGMSIGECVVLYGKNILSKSNNDPVLLDYIANEYGDKKRVNVGDVSIVIILSIIMIFVSCVMYLVVRNQKS